MWEFLANGAGPYLLVVALVFAVLTRPVRSAQLYAPATTPVTPSGAPKPTEVGQSPAPAVARSVDQAIPLPKIADRAEDLEHLLREISGQLTPKAELLELKSKAEAEAEEIRQRALQTTDLLAGTPTPLELEDERRYWRSRTLDHTTQRRLLRTLAAKVEEQLRILEGQEPQWQATWDQIQETSGLEAVVNRIRRALDTIQATRSQAREQLNMVLTLQSEISRQDQQISDVLLQIRQAQERERSRLLEPDSPPLWEVRE